MDTLFIIAGIGFVVLLLLEILPSSASSKNTHHASRLAHAARNGKE